MRPNLPRPPRSQHQGTSGSASVTSGSSAAAQIAPKVDFADIDGNLLISNDCFDGMKIVDGKITLNDRPGIGVIKL